MSNNLYPKRKPTRLKNYDYSSPGAYFITICTHNREKLLSEIVGEGSPLPPVLTECGKLVDETVNVFSEAVGIEEGLTKLKKILNKNQYEIFMAYYVHEKPLKQIAKERGIRVESVQRTAKEVVKIIKQRFSEAEFAEMIGLTH